MTPREEYVEAFGHADDARTHAAALVAKASRNLQRQIEGWDRGDVTLIDRLNIGNREATKMFDGRKWRGGREISLAIFDWLSAYSQAEIKWGGFRMAEPRATDLQSPETLIG